MKKHDANNYSAVVVPVAQKGHVHFEARLRELGHGFLATGATPQEAVANLYAEAPEFMLEITQSGQTLPEPLKELPWEEYSGKMTVRMPKSLHYKLHMIAEEEGQSLNTLVVSVLTWGAEYKHAVLRPCLPMINLNNNVSAMIMNVIAPLGMSSLMPTQYELVPKNRREPEALRVG